MKKTDQDLAEMKRHLSEGSGYYEVISDLQQMRILLSSTDGKRILNCLNAFEGVEDPVAMVELFRSESKKRFEELRKSKIKLEQLNDIARENFTNASNAIEELESVRAECAGLSRQNNELKRLASESYSLKISSLELKNTLLERSNCRLEETLDEKHIRIVSLQKMIKDQRNENAAILKTFIPVVVNVESIEKVVKKFVDDVKELCEEDKDLIASIY